MSNIDLRTVSIKPLRQTFDHIARRFGDKPASRYQEGTYDLQATHNFHYRPTWDPDREIFDPSRTKLVMKDWYALKDPRQYYYGTYTMARARQQDTAESNFDFVETRGLAEVLPEDVKQTALDVLLPLRHVAWGGNTNNAFICAYGYGTAITQPCIYQSMDQLGIAQYLTRIGLLLADPEALQTAKQAWLDDPMWQPLRRYVEDTFVLQDWFELFVAQNLVLDGYLFPLVYDTIVDDDLSSRGGTAIAMLTQFMSEWFGETAKWSDAQIKVAAAESPENKALLAQWINHWRARALEAVAPIAKRALGDRADGALDDLVQQFATRVGKTGVTL
ncbi:MAG TPA: aromatic/alkene monooxygenase hydroxylase subunit beta [Rhodocyclaceae bacterium]|nr:aromatic/alkene monooxygenase hydroxylase subunit beta [Rhodocyclaceae bacterium]HMV54459.1 aromatic/alkene monooxygenase hydroxylase subunit beta [Rhodocyclaceae bacterium]HNH14447.1 aromatic/alkene monooxygenase hydroxylase subunit beta [Rhodocyclaceae bacterium]